MTLNPAQDGYPLWSRDGKRIAFWSRQSGAASNLYSRSGDLTGGDERLTSSPNAQAPFSWTRDGRLVFQEFSPDLMMKEQKRLEGASVPTEIVVILNWAQELKRRLASEADRTR